jgi:hypothetical protein
MHCVRPIAGTYLFLSYIWLRLFRITGILTLKERHNVSKALTHSNALDAFVVQGSTA